MSPAATHAQPVSSRSAVPGSCCNTPRTLMVSESTLRASAEARSRPASEPLREWVRIAHLSPPCTVSISPREAPLTCCGYPTPHVMDPLSGRGVFPQRHLSLALRPAITWTPIAWITWARRSWLWPPTTRVPLTGCCASTPCPWIPQPWTSLVGWGNWLGTPQGQLLPSHPTDPALCNGYSNHSNRETSHPFFPRPPWRPCSPPLAPSPLRPLSRSSPTHPWSPSLVNSVGRPSNSRVIWSCIDAVTRARNPTSATCATTPARRPAS